MISFIANIYVDEMWNRLQVLTSHMFQCYRWYLPGRGTIKSSSWWCVSLLRVSHHKNVSFGFVQVSLKCLHCLLIPHSNIRSALNTWNDYISSFWERTSLHNWSTMYQNHIKERNLIAKIWKVSNIWMFNLNVMLISRYVTGGCTCGGWGPNYSIRTLPQSLNVA